MSICHPQLSTCHPQLMWMSTCHPRLMSTCHPHQLSTCDPQLPTCHPQAWPRSPVPPCCRPTTAPLGHVPGNVNKLGDLPKDVVLRLMSFVSVQAFPNNHEFYINAPPFDARSSLYK